MLYEDLLAQEEKFRLDEQKELLMALLNNPNRGKLSILRRAGLAMTGMEIVNKTTGIGGRIIIEMINGLSNSSSSGNSSGGNKNNQNQNNTCFKPGEIVKIVVSGGQLLNCYGTIERRSGVVAISLSSQTETEELELLTNSSGSGRISLIKVVDEVAIFEKMRKNLKEFGDDQIEGDLMNFLRGFMKELNLNSNLNLNLNLKIVNDNNADYNNANCNNADYDTGLNLEQNVAVEKSLKMISSDYENLLLIHGPPGTGKTSVLVEILKRLKDKKREKILICGPSNLSVDNIVERLLKSQQFATNSILRIGHPSRVLESCQRCTLDFWSENSDEGKLLKDVQKEIDKLIKNQLPRCKSREERRAIYAELKLLRQERRKREKMLQGELIKSAEIVACTLSTACGNKLKGTKFDLVIVDEAGQALLPESLIAPILGKKLLMAGDHCQLPPTVMNPDIKDKLEVSLFEHLIKKRGGDYEVIMLKEQYRMNELIMKWSNEKFYHSQLRAHESVSNWQLETNTVDDSSCDSSCEGDVLIFYDTCGFDLWESTEGSDGPKTGIIEESSKFNEGEAKIAIGHYEKLIKSGVKPDQIAIISPYSAQVGLIRDLIPENGPEINSIDAFQGREKDVVILSMVRSNAEGIVGFLAEMRRINVAMTRAKKQLVIIGDSETLSRDPELKGLVHHV